MGQRRQTKHAIASAASTRAPSASERSRKEKSHAPVAAARPARPRKLTPPPPVTDCAKCFKLAEAKATAARWHALATKLQGEVDARTKAALAGVSVTLSDADIADAIRRRYHPVLEEMLDVAPAIARDVRAPESARLTASETVINRVAGKVADKIKHEITVHVDLSAATDEELAIIEEAQAIVDRLSAKVAG